MGDVRAAVAPPVPAARATDRIRVRELRKRYPDGTEAVRGIDLSVGAGELFGFLGPNGAGKTTTIMILCTLARPSSGRAEVAGVDVVADPDAVRHRIGLLFQRTTLDPELTCAENLRFHGQLYGLSRRDLAARTGEMLDLVDLADRRDALVRTLSGGMARRLEIARGLMHRPQVLFLDEPTVGLDPYARARVWEHLHDVRTRLGTTLFLTTHQLDEAEHCDRLAIMNEGSVVAEGTPDALRSVLSADRVTLCTDDDPAAAARIRRVLGLDTTLDGGVVVRVPDGAQAVPRLCSVVGPGLRQVSVRRPSLDDVFLHHTGRALTTTGEGTG